MHKLLALINGTLLLIFTQGTVADNLLNISTRGYVGTDAEVLIAGFKVEGNSTKSALVYAAGPTLADAGVPGTLVDPELQVVDNATQQVIATNDNWRDNANAAEIEAAFNSIGLPVPKDAEPALLLTLQPGAYTARVAGINQGTGVAIVAVDDLDICANDRFLGSYNLAVQVGAIPVTENFQFVADSSDLCYNDATETSKIYVPACGTGAVSEYQCNGVPEYQSVVIQGNRVVVSFAEATASATIVLDYNSDGNSATVSGYAINLEEQVYGPLTGTITRN
jgi:hypothetical protein